MKIEIKNTNNKAVQKLISKMLDLNSNSSLDYFKEDTLVIGYNENSGFSYIYLENDPSISLVTDTDDDLCVVYSSGLDGIEFIRYDIESITSLNILEETMNKAYDLEDKIRNDDYEDDTKKDAFIEAMLNNGWGEL